MAQPSDSWYTDRSRYISGTGECSAKRYYNYHAGPYGYGFQLKPKSVPLATGTYVHEAIANILQGMTPDEGIRLAVDHYKRMAEVRGFHEPDAEVDYLIEEQCALVEALSWGWWKTTYPIIQADHDLLTVEEEHKIVIPWANEQQRLVWMTREDFATRSKASGIPSVHDLKTVSVVDDYWIDQWADSIQMMGQTLGLEAKLGEPVPQYYIHGLIKGMRKRMEYDKATRKWVGPKRQYTPLIYGWRMPPSPPLIEEQWESSHSYVDDEGKGRKLGKGWERQPVWRFMPIKDWVLNRLTPSVLEESFILLGPFKRQDYKIKQFLRSLPVEEQRWVDRLWRLYQSESKLGWGSLEFQEVLDAELPRSYACIQYRSKCPYYALCFKHPGWKDPVGSGLYVHRRPHHDPEVEQMTGRGIPVPSEEGLEAEGEPEGTDG